MGIEAELTLINGDPENPTNWRSPQELRDIGITGVRVVSRPEIASVVWMCQEANLYVLAVITGQSNIVQPDGTLKPYMLPDADAYQIGNEPDISGTGDSRSPYQYAQDLKAARANNPGACLIVGGLASGNATYLKSVRDFGGLAGYQAVAVHYPRDASVLASFQRYTSGLPICVTEWWQQSPRDIPFYRAMMRQASVALDAYFCIGYDKFWLTPEVARAMFA
jgi:hypothetical protein